jgi:hypothetical protein
LHEVVERLAGALIAPRELAGEREEALHQRIARRRVTMAVIRGQQPAVLFRAGRPV